MGHRTADAFEWETGQDSGADEAAAPGMADQAPDAGPGPDVPAPLGAPSGEPPPDDAAADAGDAAADGVDGAPDPPLWRTADDDVLHLPPRAVDQVIVTLPPVLRGWPRPTRPAPKRPRALPAVPARRVAVGPRRAAIRAVGRLVQRAQRVGTTAGRAGRPRLPVFRSRLGGRSYRILARPRAGMRHEIVAIEPELGFGAPDLEFEATPRMPAQPFEASVAALAQEWSRRRGGTPAATAMLQWLRRDLQDTLTGAQNRFRRFKVWGKRRYTDEHVRQAWLISRTEQMRFQTEMPSGLAPLRGFAPPARAVALMSSPLVQDSGTSPVAPLTVEFVRALRQRYPKFRAWNYARHGLGAFLNRGYSLDLSIDGQDGRGFFPRDAAIRFLRAVHESARAVRAEWRVIYNDFAVAKAVNQQTGARHVAFVGTVFRNASKAIVNVNWHGPDPLILHFHLDLAPAAGAAMAGETTIPGGARPAPRPASGPTRPSAPRATRRSAPRPPADADAADARRIAARAVPGLAGTTIERLVETWRPRILPEVPLPVLLAFIRNESGGRFSRATHGTTKNGWTVPAFYELGIFQTPAGLHGRCTSDDWRSCQFGPPGREGGSPSTWLRLCRRFGLDPDKWQDPTTQARVGLTDLAEGAARLRRAYPELFATKGTDWDIRMAVLYTFARGGGYARSFLTPHRRQLAALAEGQRWAFLRDKAVTVRGKRGTVRRPFLPDNVDKKMALATRLGYVPR